MLVEQLLRMIWPLLLVAQDYFGSGEEANRPIINPDTLGRWDKLSFWKANEPICVRCGKSDRPTIDHILSRRLGGSNLADNLQCLCYACNKMKARAERKLAIQLESRKYRAELRERFRRDGNVYL